MKRNLRPMVLHLALFMGLSGYVSSCVEPFEVPEDPDTNSLHSELGTEFMNATVFANGAPSTCYDYLISINGIEYKPVFLAQKFKVDRMEVIISFEWLDSELNCQNGEVLPVIEITHIERVRR